MKRFLLMLLLLVFTTSIATAQYYDKKEGEKLSRKEQRRLKKEEARRAYEINKALGMNLMEKRDFVLMADRISSKRSAIVPVSRNVNFILIDGEDLIVQYGLNNAQLGQNGVGGATFEGKIKKFDAENRGEGKPFMVSIQFQTPYLNGVATLQINVKGNQADATMWTNGRQLNFFGVYATQENSGVIQAKARGAFN